MLYNIIRFTSSIFILFYSAKKSVEASAILQTKSKCHRFYFTTWYILALSFQEFHEVPFLKKFKFKRQDRVYPKEAPTQTLTAVKAEPLASASSAPMERLPEGAPAGQ